jgi:hypothetical protein
VKIPEGVEEVEGNSLVQSRQMHVPCAVVLNSEAD